MTRSGKDTVGGTGKMMGGGLAAETSTVFFSLTFLVQPRWCVTRWGGKGAIPVCLCWLPKAQAISIRLVSAREVWKLRPPGCHALRPTSNSGVTGAGSQKKKKKNLDLSENAICRNQTRCNSPGCGQISIKPISKLLVVAVARSTRNVKVVEETNYKHTQTHHISGG